MVVVIVTVALVVVVVLVVVLLLVVVLVVVHPSWSHSHLSRPAGLPPAFKLSCLIATFLPPNRLSMQQVGYEEVRKVTQGDALHNCSIVSHA